MSLRELFATYNGLFVLAGAALVACAAVMGLGVSISRPPERPAPLAASTQPASPAHASATGAQEVVYIVRSEEQEALAQTVEREWAVISSRGDPTARPRSYRVVMIETESDEAGIRAVLNRVMAAHFNYPSAVTVDFVDLRDH